MYTIFLVSSDLRHFYPKWLIYQLSLTHGGLVTPSRSEMMAPVVITEANIDVSAI